MKADSLNFKIFSNQTVKIHTPRKDISTDRAWRNDLDLERAAKSIKNLEREESDLTFVIIFVIKETVAAQSAAGDAFDFRHFDHWKLIRLPAMVTDKIMAGRNVKMTNLHRSDDIIDVGSMKADGIGPGQIIRRRMDGALEYQHDELTIEEPLEVRIGDKTVATTMRTPGHDEELAAGFLFSEAIVRKRDDIKDLSRPAAARNQGNIIVVRVARNVKIKTSAARRFGTISSSCGLCGKESIEAIRQNFPPIKSTSFRMDIATLLSLPEKLRANQSDFARTGGIHAAGVFDANGEAVTVREDIGRHNAVDKAIGRAFLAEKLPLDRHLLIVSGRASFEIMQKALAAGIPIVASVSAPSSLAMEFAREMNQTLVGFLRPPSFNIYSHVERIILDKD
jgi:FdhD protein